MGTHKKNYTDILFIMQVTMSLHRAWSGKK